MSDLPPNFKEANEHGMNWLWLPSGALVSRFRPDSHPVVREVLQCQKSGGVAVVYAELSEEVTAVASPIQVRQAGKDLGCTDQGSKGAFLRVRCADWNPDMPLDIALAPGMVGATGKPGATFSGPAPAKWTVTIRSLPMHELGCPVFRP
ncbi:MAG: hypothetical protein EXR79_09460 [Myxococcales bacterium]|nr:hypothetical protein [Myxococcales bacterium]